MPRFLLIQRVLKLNSYIVFNSLSSQAKLVYAAELLKCMSLFAQLENPQMNNSGGTSIMLIDSVSNLDGLPRSNPEYLYLSESVLALSFKARLGCLAAVFQAVPVSVVVDVEATTNSQVLPALPLEGSLTLLTDSYRQMGRYGS